MRFIDRRHIETEVCMLQGTKKLLASTNCILPLAGHTEGCVVTWRRLWKMSFSDGNLLSQVGVFCSPSLYPLPSKVEVWHSSRFSGQCGRLHLNNNPCGEFFRCDCTEQPSCSCQISTSLCSTLTHSSSWWCEKNVLSVLTPGDALHSHSWYNHQSFNWLRNA